MHRCTGFPHREGWDCQSFGSSVSGDTVLTECSRVQLVVVNWPIAIVMII